ncbi:MAG: NTP transferase domain-containing protein [Acidobacteriota bacterium]|nr:MAG: NTP transferase domain-containing protein [Acidobacteriota bacterium]
MVLAAGYGTRLRPLTFLRAKPAVPFLNQPFIRYSLELFRGLGIKETVINLHHQEDSIREAVRGSDLEISFSYEDEILGTGGGIGAVRDLLCQDTTVVSNGKIYFEDDLEDALVFHKERGSLVTLVLVPWSEGDPFAPVLLDAEGTIVQFTRTRKEPVDRQGLRPFTFTGVHLLEPGLLDLIPEGTADIVTDVYEPLLGSSTPPIGYVSDSYWCECSTPRRYLEKSLDQLKRRGLDSLCEGEKTGKIRNSVIGSGASFSDSVVLSDCVVWEGVRIEGTGTHRNTIFATSLTDVPASLSLDNAVVVPNCREIVEHKPEYAFEAGDVIIWPLEPK